MLSLGISPVVRRSAVVAGVIISAAACSDEATAPKAGPRVPESISAIGNPDLGKAAIVSPVVDGKIGQGEYSGAAAVKFTATLPPTIFGPGQTPVVVYVQHDQKYLYIATVFDRKAPFHPNDLVGFEFDLDNDGITENGDDVLVVGASGTQNVVYPGADFYRWNNGVSNQSDAATGGTIDAISSWGAIGTKGTFEIRQPLNSADDAHDMSIDLSTGPKTIGMRIAMALEAGAVGSGNNVWTFKPGQTTFCQLSLSKYSVNVTCP